MKTVILPTPEASHQGPKVALPQPLNTTFSASRFTHSLSIIFCDNILIGFLFSTCVSKASSKTTNCCQDYIIPHKLFQIKNTLRG